MRSFAFVVGLGLSLLLPACAAASRDDDADASEAELVANFNRQGITDLTTPTHVMIVGDSHELGTLPLKSATTRARRYVDLYPNDQIILFVTGAVADAKVAATGATVIRREGLGATTIASLSKLNGTSLVRALDRFTQIVSIDFFGHSSPFAMNLESEGDDRWLTDYYPNNVADLADNFARDRHPFVALHGCNGGAKMAPELSRMWRLPVAGALTATNFEVLMADGVWYPDDDGRYPQGLENATANDRSFSRSTPSCASGACVRMKPENAPYYGKWSQPDGFQYGLNYYKFFCKFDDPDQRCAKGMATSLLAFPSIKPIDATSSEEDVKIVLGDFFCNSSIDPAVSAACRANLFAAAAAGTPFSPMKGANDYSLECDFSGCEQKLRCTEVDGAPQAGTCAWVEPSCETGQSNATCRTKNVVKQTTNHEVNRYLEGFSLLRGT